MLPLDEALDGDVNSDVACYGMGGRSEYEQWQKCCIAHRGSAMGHAYYHTKLICDPLFAISNIAMLFVPLRMPMYLKDEERRPAYGLCRGGNST